MLDRSREAAGKIGRKNEAGNPFARACPYSLLFASKSAHAPARTRERCGTSDIWRNAELGRPFKGGWGAGVGGKSLRAGNLTEHKIARGTDFNSHAQQTYGAALERAYAARAAVVA